MEEFDTGMKEVYFDQYCKKCKYSDLDEAEDPCDECLSHPTNIYSHKPINYVIRRKHD